MKYYVYITEQIVGSEGAPTEYSNVKKYGTEQEAMVYFYTRCSEIANALGKTHHFGYLEVKTSLGGIVKKDSIGSYIETAV